VNEKKLGQLVVAGVKLREIRNVAETGDGHVLLDADECAAMIEMVRLARCPDPEAH
jgi:hypothetical protein